MKTIVLTGGGTAGHVTPNIALIPSLKKEGYQLHYIGSKNGPEKNLIKGTGIEYHAIHSGKLRRYFDIKNITDIFLIAVGFFEALIILRKIKPSLIFSKGGFVTCPVIWAAWLLKIPAVIHESDISPGLANKLTLPFAEKICCSFPETMKLIPKSKGVYTGLPVREIFFIGKRSKGLSFCGFSGKKPVILIIGGSQGALAINKTVRPALDLLIKKFDICHICGKGNIDLSVQRKGYRQFEYVDAELPDIFAASDIIVSRAGATSVFEILASGKASLLIPLGKEASRGDQIDNAKSLFDRGMCNVLDQSLMTAESLISAINYTNENKEKYVRAIKEHPSTDGVTNVIAIIKATINITSN